MLAVVGIGTLRAKEPAPGEGTARQIRVTPLLSVTGEKDKAFTVRVPPKLK